MITYQENWISHFVSFYAWTEQLPWLNELMVLLLGSKRSLLSVPKRGTKPRSPALQADSITLSYQGSPEQCWLAKKTPPKLNNVLKDMIKIISCIQVSPVQLLSHVWLFATPFTAACEASLSITNSWILLKHVSIELVMPTNHLILCYPLPLLLSIFPSIKVFSNESALCSAGQSTGVSVSTSVLPTNNQDWSPLGWTGWISLQSKGLSRVFSNTTVQKHQFFSSQLSL